jgi:hypothetical protein
MSLPTFRKSVLPPSLGLSASHSREISRDKVEEVKVELGQSYEEGQGPARAREPIGEEGRGVSQNICSPS